MEFCSKVWNKLEFTCKSNQAAFKNIDSGQMSSINSFIVIQANSIRWHNRTGRLGGLNTQHKSDQNHISTGHRRIFSIYVNCKTCDSNRFTFVLSNLE